MKSYKQVLIIMMIILTSLSVNAQRGNGNGKGNCKNVGICEKLPDLTDKQKEQIKELKIKHKKAMLQFRNQMDVERANLRTLEIADNAEMNKINAQIDKITGVKNQMMKARAAHRQDVRKLLTEEQKVIFDSQTGRKGKGKGHRKGRGNCNGNGNRANW